VIISGANLVLSSEDVHNAESLISSARVVVCQLEIRPDVTLDALKLAREHKGNCTALLLHFISAGVETVVNF